MRSTTLILTSALLSSLTLGGCNLAPQYHQPAVPIAPAFSDVGKGDLPVADLGWRDFFLDPRLQVLIGTALERNRELAQSYAKIEQARAQYRIQATERLPTVDGSTSATRSHQPLAAVAPGGVGGAGGSDAPNSITIEQYSANLGVSAFELDLWGRVRNLSEAERQRYLATVEGMRAFRLSLVAQVAAAYFDIRAGEERTKLAEQTLEGRREGERIARMRLDAGVTSTVDYDQTVLLLTQAQTELADILRTTEVARNLLEVLVGGPLETDLPSPALNSAPLRAIAAGLPSELLINRPDILQAEHNLRAANADIGAARAAFFPSISLTGAFGFISNTLDGLFDKDNQTWNYGATVGLPIFDWGRRESQLRLSKAAAEELTAIYQHTVQTAFKEVSDGLVGRKRYAEQIAAQKRTVETQRRLARTARMRYDNGIAIYLEVLDAERNLFASGQQLIQLRALEQQNAVGLYVSLGGDAGG